MAEIPTVPLPPDGAIELLCGMQEYLPEEWERWAAARAAQETHRKSVSVLPGRTRWPETDPRRLEAVKAAHNTRSQAVKADQQSAWVSLVAALFTRLSSGVLFAYAVPTSLDGVYRLIPPTVWQQQARLSVRSGNIVGLPTGPVKVVLWRAKSGDALGRRGPGRPRAEVRDHVENEYRRRRQSGEGLEGAHREAAAIVRILRERHPEKKFPQKQTMARWIRDWVKVPD